MRIGLMSPDSEAGIQHEHTAVRPGCKESSLVGRWLERRIVLLESNVHVLERGGCGSGRSHGEGQSMGLVVVVIGVLADDNNLDVVELGVAGPDFPWSEGDIKSKHRRSIP